jgi:glycosyltransferase involved in cell wall biosynthesis
MTYRIGFLMEQNAGHLTNYRNLRSVVEEVGPVDIHPDWHELHYRREGGRIERLQGRYPSFVPSYLAGNTRMLLEFRKALMGGLYDAVLTNSWAAMFFTRRLSQIPTVIDFDSTPVQIDRMAVYGSPHDPAPVAALKHRLAMRAYRSARLLQAWSNWAKESVVRDYGLPADKVVVNPPGVDLDFLHPLPQRERAPSDKLRVVFVGGDFERKGGDLLLDWFRHQDAGVVELHLATRDAVEVGPGVVLHSVSPNSPELRALYQQSDVFVLPSLGECFGLATVEAMACGLPVIVSNVGGTADIVRDGENGFIVKAGDPGELSTALTAILSDPSQRRAMGASSRCLAETYFDARRNAQRTLSALQDLAEAHTRRPRAGSSVHR